MDVWYTIIEHYGFYLCGGLYSPNKEVERESFQKILTSGQNRYKIRMMLIIT
jgi:hypothetical protein